jgi:putative hydrolase of the HAD superfamily
MIDLIAFDGDDTLWNNETLYSHAKDRFQRLFSKTHPPEWVKLKLDEIEIHNLKDYGYGIKSFTLSMIEAALELSDSAINAGEMREVLHIARQMHQADVELFAHAEETLAKLSGAYPLMLITKGDTFEQERKIRRSGLARYFQHIEIIGDKSAETYLTILDKHHIDPHRFLMVGNSLRSDILPVISLGGIAVYIPYAHTWSHEIVEDPDLERGRYYELEHLGQLPALVSRLKHS